jgi:hypothetical protein
MHLHTVYMAYSECFPTRLNPLAERTCFSQVGREGADAELRRRAEVEVETRHSVLAAQIEIESEAPPPSR